MWNNIGISVTLFPPGINFSPIFDIFESLVRHMAEKTLHDRKSNTTENSHITKKKDDAVAEVWIVEATVGGRRA